MRIGGVDGCKAGWIAVCADAGNLASATPVYAKHLRDLVVRESEAFLVVDMPVGLVDGPQIRTVEKSLRGFLGGKSSSVFNAPSRKALSCDSYEQACQVNREALGMKMSRQSYALFPKMRIVDEVVADIGQTRLREGHPEASFAAMNGAPVLASKKTVAGAGRRIDLLQKAGLPVTSIMKDTPVGGIGIDDLLDAAALLWSANRYVENKHQTFPAEPDRNSAGLEMSVIA